MATKKEVIRERPGKYLKASRQEKTVLLDHLTTILGQHRKAVIRAFKREQMANHSRPERRGRPVFYTPDAIAALKTVWQAASYICGELLHPVITEYAALLLRDDLWTHSKEATEKLLIMSQGTVKAKVTDFAKKARLRHRHGTTRSSPLLDTIPMVVGEWHDKPPGYGQVDTVAHCGQSLVGDFIYTVNYTDIATFWVIPRAQWNKGQIATTKSLAGIKEQLPVALCGLHPDSGSEFINHNLKSWCQAQTPVIELSRSRPYHKNDNAYVEQKNGHVVRRFVGHRRLDLRPAAPLFNQYYEVLALYLNHFVSSRKCLKKVKVGSRYRRQYDIAQTPYQRMLAHSEVPRDVKERLKQKHEQLNPLLLKQQADRLLTKVFNHQKALR